MSETYLYILRDGEGRLRYVGIGGRQRPYEMHNDEYDELIKTSSDIRITARPFSTRADAEMAESLLIRALVDAESSGVLLTNRAKVTASKDLVPLHHVAEGHLRYSDLQNTIIVAIQPGQIDDVRAVLSGVTPPEKAAERCSTGWPLGQCIAEGRDVRFLLAISSKLSPVRVLGSWRTRPTTEWTEPNAIALNDPHEADALAARGCTFSWDGYPGRGRPAGPMAYSLDLMPA